MASPLNNLRRLAKVSGQLVSTSDEELQALSEAAGRPAQPTSPLEGGVLGANPDQAKMAGSGANKLAALRTSIRTESDVFATQKRQQDRTARTAEEQASADAATPLTGLGSLDSRVQDIANKIFAPATAPTAVVQGLSVNEEALKAAVKDGTTLTRAQELAAKLGTGTASPAELVELASLVGITDSSIPAEKLQADLKKLFLSGAEGAGSAIANALPNDVLLSQALSAEELAETAAAMGLTAEQLGAMNAGQFQQEITKFQQAGSYQNLTRLQQQAADPFASAADRELARRQLREYGTTGMRAVERQLDTLLDDVRSSSSVSINGTSYTVGELLNDETIAADVKDYLESPEGRARVLSKYGEGFGAWVDENQQVLTEAVQKLDDSVTELSRIQEENRQLSDLGPQVGQLDDSTMSAIFPSWGTLSAERLADTPLLAMLKDPQYAAVAPEIADGLNRLAAAGLQEDVRELASMDYGSLQQLGLTTREGFSRYQQYRQALTSLQAADPQTAFEQLFLGTEGQLNQLLSDQQAILHSGLVGLPKTQLLAKLDRNGDGKPDIDGKMKDDLLASLGGATSLKELLASGKGVGSIRTPAELLEADLRTVNNAIGKDSLLGKLRGAFSDGQLSHAELAAASLTPDDAARLAQMPKELLTTGARGTVNRLLSSAHDGYLTTAIQQFGMDRGGYDALVAGRSQLSPADSVAQIDQLLAQLPLLFQKNNWNPYFQNALKTNLETLTEMRKQYAAKIPPAAQAPQKTPEQLDREFASALLREARDRNNAGPKSERNLQEVNRLLEKYGIPTSPWGLTPEAQRWLGKQG